jgi:RHS repeat-associated protein
LIASTGTTSNNDLYAGEQLDGNLGFYYLRARYLNPSFGRFWTTDEFAGDLMSPNTLHKYLYAAADPVNRLDPSGNMFFIASLVGTAGDLVQRDIAETSKLAALQAMKFMLIGLGVGVLGVTAAQIVQRIEVPIRAQHYTTYWGLAKIFSTPPFGEIKNPAPGGLNYYTFDLYINGRDAQRNLAVCRRLEVAVQLTLFIKSDQLTWPPAKVEPFKCLDGETQPGGGTQVSTSMPIPVLTRQPVFWPLF